MTRIVLHIDRLVLRGVDRADAAAVAAALKAELHRLLGADGAAALRGQAGAHALQAGRAPLPHGADAAALGRAVAARIAAPPARGAVR